MSSAGLITVPLFVITDVSLDSHLIFEPYVPHSASTRFSVISPSAPSLSFAASIFTMLSSEAYTSASLMLIPVPSVISALSTINLNCFASTGSKQKIVLKPFSLVSPEIVFHSAPSSEYINEQLFILSLSSSITKRSITVLPSNTAVNEDAVLSAPGLHELFGLPSDILLISYPVSSESDVSAAL